jgi:metallo-beta-lactamase class B
LKLNHLTRWLLTCLSFATLVATAVGQSSAQPCKDCSEWNRSQKPFRVFGNTYYVGPHGLSSILITSPAGHVLIDGDLPQSVKQIVASIRALGFKIEDVKIILNSHVHFDHAGGIAELQRLSGARVIASEWSAGVMKKGGVGRGDPQYGTVAPIARVENVTILDDGETFAVGRVSVTAHLTPGHTPGGTSWTWKSCEGDVCHEIVYADSLTPVSADGFRFTRSREYPQALADFEKSFAFLETAPCDVLITTHPDTSELWDRVERRERGVKPDPLVDSDACRQLAQHGRERLQERLAEERKKQTGK